MNGYRQIKADSLRKAQRANQYVLIMTIKIYVLQHTMNILAKTSKNKERKRCYLWCSAVLEKRRSEEGHSQKEQETTE